MFRLFAGSAAVALVCVLTGEASPDRSQTGVRIQYRRSYVTPGAPAGASTRVVVAARGSLLSSTTGAGPIGDKDAGVIARHRVVVLDSSVVFCDGQTRYFTETPRRESPWLLHTEYHELPWMVLPDVMRSINASADAQDVRTPDGSRRLGSASLGQGLEFDAAGDLRRWTSAPAGRVPVETSYAHYENTPTGRWSKTRVTRILIPASHGREAPTRGIRDEFVSASVLPEDVESALRFEPEKMSLRRHDPVTDRVYNASGEFQFVRSQHEAAIVAAFDRSDWTRRGIYVGVGVLGLTAAGLLLRKARRY